MKEPKDDASREAQRLVDVLAGWFDRIPVADRAEAEEIVRDAGLDPADVGERMRELASRALGTSDEQAAALSPRPRPLPRRSGHSRSIEPVRLATRSGGRGGDRNLAVRRARPSRQALAWGAALFVVGAALGWLVHASMPQQRNLVAAAPRAALPGAAPAVAPAEEEGAAAGTTRSAADRSWEKGGGLTARAVLDRAQQLAETKYRWGDRTQALSMNILSKEGIKRKLAMMVYTKHRLGSVDESLAVVRSPDDAGKTTFLQLMQDGYVEHLLYLPGSGRIQQLGSRGRDESFAGTDFTYRDLDLLAEIPRWSDEDIGSAALRGTDSEGPPSYVIDLALQGGPYRRLSVWIDRVFFTLRKLAFVDRDGAEAKTLTLDDIREVESIPTAHWIEMRNAKTGSRTVVEVTETQYNSGLGNRLFGDLKTAAYAAVAPGLQ